MRRFLLSNTINTRDLGGYPIGNSKYTAYKKFIRSDVIEKVSDDDIKLLLENKITTIVDLRNDEEVKRRPSAFRGNNAFDYRHCKMYGDGRIPDKEEDIAPSYFEMVEEEKSMLKIMKVIANAKDGVLYHCTAGKDRTGVVSALLLSLAGVADADIFADYIISQAYYYPLIQKYYKENPEIPIEILTPKIEYMIGFLDLFYDKYNTAEDYLLKIGLSNSEILNLKKKLIILE